MSAMEATVVSETVQMSLAISVSHRVTAPSTEHRVEPWRTPLAIIVVAGLALRLGYVSLYRHHVRLTGDAFYYHYQANLLASGKGFINPYSLYYGLKVVPGASHPPLWTLVLALAAVVGIKTFFGQLLYSCGIGAVSVALVGMAGREVAGPRAGLIAAGITAVYPVFLIDDGSLLAETLVVPLTALMVWAFYRLWHRPTLARAALLGALCALAALTRSELVLLVGFLALPAGLLLGGRSWRTRLGLCAASLIAALCIFAPWWAYTLPRFSHPEFLSDQLGVTLASANCNQTYHGRLLGYWSFSCAKGPINPGEDASAADKVLRSSAIHYVEHHLDRVPVVMAARFGRAFGVFVPWQEIDLEWARIGRPRLPATIGLFSYYVIAVTAVGGAVVLRRRKVSLFPVAIILGEVALVAVAIFGQTRYRTPLDVVLVILAGVALDHLRAERSKGPGRHARRSRGAPRPLVSAGEGSYVAPEVGPAFEAAPEVEPEVMDHHPPLEIGGISAAPDAGVEPSDSFWSRPKRP
jgi:4-amino-4-deoxy-L-arabinose transferase-like glycosyltransferase